MNTMYENWLDHLGSEDDAGLRDRYLLDGEHNQMYFIVKHIRFYRFEEGRGYLLTYRGELFWHDITRDEVLDMDFVAYENLTFWLNCAIRDTEENQECTS